MFRGETLFGFEHIRGGKQIIKIVASGQDGVELVLIGAKPFPNPVPNRIPRRVRNHEPARGYHSVGIQREVVRVLSQNLPSVETAAQHEVLPPPGVIAPQVAIGVQGAPKIRGLDHRDVVPNPLSLEFRHEKLQGLVHAGELGRECGGHVKVVVVSTHLEVKYVPLGAQCAASIDHAYHLLELIAKLGIGKIGRDALVTQYVDEFFRLLDAGREDLGPSFGEEAAHGGGGVVEVFNLGGHVRGGGLGVERDRVAPEVRYGRGGAGISHHGEGGPG